MCAYLIAYFNYHLNLVVHYNISEVRHFGKNVVKYNEKRRRLSFVFKK